MFRQLKGYDIIFKYLKEGEIIFEILHDITGNREVFGQAYRLDVYETACAIFRYCHLVLVMFCEGNLDNQAVLADRLPLFLTNTYINFGQIELLRRICKRQTDQANDKQVSAQVTEQKNRVLTQHADAILKFLFDLIVKHGQLPEVVHFLIDLVHANEQANVFIKKAVLQKLFSVDYLCHLKVGSPDKVMHCYAEAEAGKLKERRKDEDAFDLITDIVASKVHYYDFSELVDPDSFEVLLVCLLGSCVDRKSGINFISKCFELYPFHLLITSFRYRLERTEAIDTKDRLTTYFEKIVRLADTFLATFEKSFLEFLIIDKNEENILAVFKKIQSLLEVAIPYQSRQYFGSSLTSKSRILDLLRLSTRIGQVLLRFADNTIDIDRITAVLANFNAAVLKEFGTLATARDFNHDDLETLKAVVKVFKLPLPSNLEAIVSENQKRQMLEVPDKSGSSMYPSDSFRQPPTPDLSESALSLRSSNMSNQTIEQFDMTPAQMMELSIQEKWAYFQKNIGKHPSIVEHLELEPDSLTSTVINFVMSYNDDDFCDMMIFCEDLCSKMVECVEFWVQRKLSRVNVAFILNLLGRIIKAAKTPQDCKKIQDMLNRLSLVRILIKLFTQEGDYDIPFMYQISELLSFLLMGGNRVD
jgi:hypothetical protein